MKKLILAITILLLASCTDRGQITTEPTDFIEINGKVYKLMSVVPEDGEHSIWIMYPKDSTDKMPTVLNYEVPEGKTTRNETVIKVE